jgi:2-keto-4-pentenoate hydratase/2-oxohepta-3-ene-1,7-dioic acid hydratase (catechol pathway)
MKLATYVLPSEPTQRIGLLQPLNGSRDQTPEALIDITTAGQLLHLSLPQTLQAVIEQYADVQPHLQTILSASQQGKLADAIVPLKGVTLIAPLPRPRKNVMCMAVNYTEHARETAALRGHAGKPPTDPVIFTKAPTTINGPFGTIEIDPAVSTAIDWEVELGVIIGTTGKNISPEEALTHVFGYTVLNDVTARDLQVRHKQFFKGKSLDGSCPIGPWIVTADEISDPHNLALHLRVNGITKQEDNTRQMIFSIPEIIATLSLGMTIEAGDIIATGTPSGVGFSRPTPEFLQPGDIMESEIEGIGIMRNPIVAKK